MIIKTAQDAIDALVLPANSLVGQRVPKKLLVENGAPTAADKRKINENIEELTWVAALKPSTVGVVEYRDADREYLEIAVLSVQFRGIAKPARLIELIHRAIPYPVFLISTTAAPEATAEATPKVTNDALVSLSTANKRRSQNKADATVLDGSIAVVDSPSSALGAALSIAKQPRPSLLALYHGWVETLETERASRVTGSFFQLPASAAAAEIRRKALADLARLDVEISGVRAAAKRERQMSKQVELNMRAQKLEADRKLAAAQCIGQLPATKT